MHTFGPAGRLGALAGMEQERLDLLVIGGGITGCGLAREAALQGLRVGLVERDDFGSGTSSRSSKLVHGGLRYLAQGDLRMVRESLREREVLRRLAPHLVRPVDWVYPLYRGRTHWPVHLGFYIFDLLGAGGHRLLTPGEVLERAPALGLPVEGGIAYQEYTTDDARLTLANAISAWEHGALVANHAAVVRLAPGEAVVQDTLTNREVRVRARVIVNATGPWAERTMRLGAGAGPGRLLLSKGIHLLFAAERLPVEGAIFLRSPSGREGFAVRRGSVVYVGTTDVAHDGAPDHPTADEAAIADLLALAQVCFPACELHRGDVLGTWAGLRPLVAEPGKPPRDTSRHDQIWVGPDGLITIAGGKLTTYRSMAKRVMRQVWRALNRRPPGGDRSAEVPLPGGDRAAELRAYGPAWLEPLAPGVPVLRGDVRFAVEREMAMTVDDFVDRRSGYCLFHPYHRAATMEATAEIMADLQEAKG